jgi:Tfp pilus assembly protein PilW
MKNNVKTDNQWVSTAVPAATPDNSGLTLVEVMIALLITLVLFLALMQGTLISMDLNTGNSLRNEAVSIAEERIRNARNITDNAGFDALANDNYNSLLVDASCPAGLVKEFGISGMLYDESEATSPRAVKIRNIQALDFCTYRTVDTISADIKQVNIAVGWVWKGEDHIHRVSTVLRRP